MIQAHSSEFVVPLFIGELMKKILFFVLASALFAAKAWAASDANCPRGYRWDAGSTQCIYSGTYEVSGSSDPTLYN